jgi:hypothetical protein
VHGLRNSSLSSFPLATSAINHLTVRVRRQIVWCSSRATAICHVDKSQWSHGAPDGPVPHRKGNQPIRGFSACTVRVLFTVRCATGQSGAPTNSVTPQVLPRLEHTLVLRTVITCGRDLRKHIRTLEIMCYQDLLMT